MVPVRRGIPILLYHSIAEETDPYLRRFSVPPAMFTRQLAWLRQKGYQAINLQMLVGLLDGPTRTDYRKPDGRVVVISFDDGFSDFATLAWPALKSYGYPASLFVVDGRVGGTNDWDGDHTGVRKPLLAWGDLRQLAAEGVEIGSHGLTHRSLVNLALKDAREEILSSRTRIAEALGRDVAFFAYPFGGVDRDLVRHVAESGYRAALSATSGLNSRGQGMFDLRRTEIRGTDSLFEFYVKVSTGYASLGDWVQSMILWRKAHFSRGDGR